LLAEELEQRGQVMRTVELQNVEFNERNRTLEKSVRELEWRLHEQDAVKNARCVYRIECSFIDG
jgi:hypothetical protein